MLRRLACHGISHSLLGDVIDCTSRGKCCFGVVQLSSEQISSLWPILGRALPLHFSMINSLARGKLSGFISMDALSFAMSSRHLLLRRLRAYDIFKLRIHISITVHSSITSRTSRTSRSTYMSLQIYIASTLCENDYWGCQKICVAKAF